MLLKMIGIITILAVVAECAPADSQSEIAGQMQRFHKAAVEKDVVAMESLLLDTYLLITRNGKTNTKKEYMDRLHSGATPATADIKYQHVRVQVYGTTGIVTETETTMTTQGPINLVATSVWVKDQGQWKLAFRQNTIAP